MFFCSNEIDKLNYDLELTCMSSEYSRRKKNIDNDAIHKYGKKSESVITVVDELDELNIVHIRPLHGLPVIYGTKRGDLKGLY